MRRAAAVALSVAIIAGCDGGGGFRGDPVEGVPGSSAATPAIGREDRLPQAPEGDRILRVTPP
jgi:hypothetical protein